MAEDPLERQERAEGEWMVRKGGLEPPRYCYRQPLKLVRLPIPPLPRGVLPPGNANTRQRRSSSSAEPPVYFRESDRTTDAHAGPRPKSCEKADSLTSHPAFL